MNNTKTIYFADKIPFLTMMLSCSILFGAMSWPMTLQADVTVYLDPVYSTDGKDIRLTVENLMDPNFPKPKNQLPVLFVPGYELGNETGYREIFQQPFNGQPCFRDTLLETENSPLEIEPYYMDLETPTEDENVSIAEDAGKIEEAVRLILLHQGGPDAKTKKVVIIAYGSGAVSTRYYLKDLWERQNKKLSFHPVSEFIAISPLSRGLNEAAPIDFCEQLFASEAPGSRGNNEPIENGILYVTLYAEGNRDMVVHTPEIICKALYTAFYHQAPPEELVFKRSDEKNPLSPPIIPPLQIPKRDMGIVLLFDISTGISEPMPAIRKAAERFLHLLGDYCSGSRAKVNLGMAVFPSLPWNDQKDCSSQAVIPMTFVSETCIDNAVKTLNCLKAKGNSPLLQGIDTALQMFGRENRKVVILVSDGHHDCPAPVNVNTDDNAVKSLMANLDEKGVTFYAVGIGQDVDMNHRLLRKLAGDRPKHLEGKFIPVMEPADPGTSIEEAYKLIFAEVMKLEEARSSLGIIKAREAITLVFKVNEFDRQISFLLRWQTPQKERLRFTVTASDGNVVPDSGEGVRVHKGETYMLVTVKESFLKQAGKVGTAAWKVHIMAPGPKDGEQENYQCSVIMDSGLKMKPGFDKTSYNTGDIITFTAAVTEGENQRPVPDLTDVSVKVTPPIKSFTGVQRPRGAGSLLVMKEPLVAEGIRLYDDGSHGDKKKEDGIYTNQYTETVNEGTYRFLFHVGGESFAREKEEPVYVAVKADPVYSSLSTRWRDIFVDQQAQYIYDVEFVPRDRYGNYIGSGHAVDVEIVYKDKESIDHSFVLKDNQDGTYSGEIGIIRSGLETGARMVLMMDGKPFTAVEKIPGFRKWSLGIHGGAGFPISFFKHHHNAGIHFSGNIGYRLTPTFSLVGLLGYNYFSSSSSLSRDSLWWNISANLRSEIAKNPLRFYINAGAGIYISKSGALTSGVNVGTGAAYSLKSNYIIELGMDFHLVNRLGNDSTFFVTHAGLVHLL